MAKAVTIHSQRSVAAVFLTFFVNGALFGTWVSRIPAIQTQLRMNEALLGLVLLGLSAGVVAGLSLAAGWISRKGSKAVTTKSFAVTWALLPALAFAPTPSSLAVLLFLVGAALSVMDVAMNEQAVFVDQQNGSPLMSRFHGAFSLGGLVGALIGAVLAGSDIQPAPHFISACLLFGIVMLIAIRDLPRQTHQQQKTEPLFSLPRRPLWPLGLVALISSVGEGAMADWSAVFLVKALDSPEGTAALGFAAYSLTMTIARLLGDRLNGKFTPKRIVQGGGWIATSGLLIVVLTPQQSWALAGLMLVGLGLANIIPIAFTAAGHFPGVAPETGIASVATIGYAGFLAGPPIIGLVADITSLRTALMLLTPLLALLPWVATAVNINAQK